ncbi:MAG: DnaB helicase C-terminal domain-containing protein [Tenericutes bacterium]|nr:DnaB helicase C-terminal domain-containing protein [Mycoplasmatota bacterium]
MFESREVIEQEYLSLLLNESYQVEFCSLKPIEFKDVRNRRLYESIIKSYKETKSISLEYVPSDLCEYWCEILDGYYERYNVENQFHHCEEMIEQYYKEERILSLTKELEANKIDYKVFIEKVKELDSATTVLSNDILTEEEIKNNLTISKTGITFNNFPKLSRELKLLQNDLLVVGATTGVGKSGFLLNLMNDLMTRYQCIYFNLEMSKSNIYRRMVAINQEFAVNSIDNPSDYQKVLISKAIENIKNSKVIVNHSANNILDIKKVIRKFKDKNKHTVVFIDHIGYLKYQNKKSIYEESTETVKELRKICLEYGCTIIAASQLNRSAYEAKEITLNMLKDSGELENSSRKIILLSYKDKKDKDNLEPTMLVDIAKNDNGSTGVTEMKYIKVRQTFNENWNS